MALEHAILVSLAEQAASGYDLTRRFERSIGHFWRASHQQIYRVLARMQTDGLVAARSVRQTGKPDKKIYAVTAAGRAELTRWAAEPTEPESLRSDFAVKLRALPLIDRDALLDDVRARRAAHAERLGYYRASAKRFYPDADTDPPDDLGGYLVLRGGLLAERTGIAWCDEILAALDPS